MALRKSPPMLIDAFDRALPKHASVQRRRMFGFPAAFVNGNLFCGLYQEDVMVRLSPELRDALADAGGARWEPTPGRVMREYMLLPRGAATRVLRQWLCLSFEFVCTLPPKASKAKQSKRRAR